MSDLLQPESEKRLRRLWEYAGQYEKQNVPDIPEFIVGLTALAVVPFRVNC